MRKACTVCGSQLSWLGSVLNKTVCHKCRVKAESHYDDLLAAIFEGRADPIAAKARLIVLAAQASLDDDSRRKLNRKAFEQFLGNTLARYPALSEKDEAALRVNEIANALGVDQAAILQTTPSLMLAYRVALANAGRLIAISSVGILLKKDEEAYLEVGASLLQEVHRTTRRYSGVSFRIVRGVYYHVGQSHPLTTSAIKPVDSGNITVTSNRVVYTGNRQSLEMSYTKLLAVQIFTDGIEFHLSNRKTAPLFGLSDSASHLVAATVNAAFQRQAH